VFQIWASCRQANRALNRNPALSTRTEKRRTVNQDNDLITTNPKKTNASIPPIAQAMRAAEFVLFRLGRARATIADQSHSYGP
jgi:hypothetical protein